MFNAALRPATRSASRATQVCKRAYVPSIQRRTLIQLVDKKAYFPNLSTPICKLTT